MLWRADSEDDEKKEDVKEKAAPPEDVPLQPEVPEQPEDVPLHLQLDIHPYYNSRTKSWDPSIVLTCMSPDNERFLGSLQQYIGLTQYDKVSREHTVVPGTTPGPIRMFRINHFGKTAAALSTKFVFGCSYLNTYQTVVKDLNQQAQMAGFKNMSFFMSPKKVAADYPFKIEINKLPGHPNVSVVQGHCEYLPEHIQRQFFTRVCIDNAWHTVCPCTA